MKNNNKERSFIIEYLKDFNGARAAIKAGYSRKAAKEIASRLLTKANIKGSIEKALAKRQEKTAISAERVIKEVAAIRLLGKVRVKQKNTPSFSGL